jgi:MFS family permease
MREKILGLRKNIFFLGLVSLFNDFSSEMVFSVIPAFFVSVLKAGAGSLGIVDGAAEAASNIFKIYSGALSDKFQSRKPLVIVGYSLSVVTRPFYMAASGVLGVFGLRIADRLGKGLRDSPRDAIISLSTPREELGKSFGYHRAMDTVGATLGPLAAYFILRAFPQRFDYVFLSAFLVGLLAIVSLFFISDVAAAALSPERRSGIASSWRALSGEFKKFIAAIFVLSVGSLPVAVILLKTSSVGLSIADIPLFYMLYNLSYAIFSLPAGKVSDKIGAKKVIISGYVLLIFTYAMLSLSSGPISLSISFLLLGFFPALTDGVQRAMASQLVGEERRGEGLGWLNASYGVGALIAGILGGLLWQAFGPTVAFVTSAVIVAIGLFVFSASKEKPAC